ncbi:MAG TPA: hypothetical protein VE262_10055 [Blastocatellia bacterium]|nr:hypothetical protein [Blastocatellia bacterium]
MQPNSRSWTRRVAAAAALALALGLAGPVADAKKLWKNEWIITVTVPDSPSGNHFGTRTFNILARNFNAPPSPLPLRKLTATAEDTTAVQGVWRQVGKNFSLTFELPCEPGSTCGTLLVRGRFNSKTTMRGQAYMVWDTPDPENVARFETVNGTFEGVKK